MTIAFALACFALAAIVVLMARPLLAMVSGNSDGAPSSRSASMAASIGGRLSTFLFDTDEYDDAAPLAPAAASATPALVAAEHVPTTPMVVTTKPQPAASYASPYPAYATGGGATYAPPAPAPFRYY